MRRLALPTLCLLLSLTAARAQVFRSSGGGPPASVTSMTGSGFNPGIPASVTSMRPVFRATPSQPFFHHRFHRRNFVPVFIPIDPYGEVYGAYDLTNEDPYAPSYAQPQPPAASQPEPQAPAQTVFENRPGYKPPPPAPNATAEVSAPAPPAPPEKAAPEEPEPKTVLVFKDGHKLEVGNYVIVGDTLYNLSGAYRSYKIALADLDIKATVKANADRGLEFHVPETPAKNAA